MWNLFRFCKNNLQRTKIILFFSIVLVNPNCSKIDQTPASIKQTGSTNSNNQISNNRKQPSHPPPSTEVYIPGTLNEALRKLKTMLDPDFVRELKSSDESLVAIRYHFSLGLWMRNNWALMKGGQLSNFFREQGIYSPEVMSSIILVAFWRTSHNQPINIEELTSIMYWEKYWKTEAR